MLRRKFSACRVHAQPSRSSCRRACGKSTKTCMIPIVTEGRLLHSSSPPAPRPTDAQPFLLACSPVFSYFDPFPRPGWVMMRRNNAAPAPEKRKRNPKVAAGGELPQQREQRFLFHEPPTGSTPPTTTAAAAAGLAACHTGLLLRPRSRCRLASWEVTAGTDS